MASLAVNVATVPVALPAGVVAGFLQVNLCNADGSVFQSQNIDGTTVSFSDVPPGTYFALVQRLDSNGAPLGAAARSDTVSIASYDAPSTVTLTIA